MTNPHTSTGTIGAALLGSRGVPPSYGGFETLAGRIATMGGEGKIKWWIYCPAENNPPPQYGQALTTPVLHGKSPYSAFFYDIRSLWHASRRDDIQVIVMLGYGAGPFHIIPRLFGKKLIVNTDGFEYLRAKWPLWVKWGWRVAEAFTALLADELISDSINVSHYFSKRYGKKSTFIAYGVEVPEGLKDKALQGKFQGFLKEHHLKPREYYITVMRLEPENSLYEMCQAVYERDRGKPLLLLGPSTPFFEKKVRPRFVDNVKVIWPGPVYERGLLYLLRKNAYCYLHGHTVGGVAPTLAEALITETPIISRKTVFNEEVLEEAGLYFTDVDSLKQKLDFMERVSPEEWAALAQGVKDRIRPCYTWEQIVKDYEILVENTWLGADGSPGKK